MARCPFATWKPLPQNTTQRNDNDDIQVIFHSLTSPSALSSWEYFAGKNALGTEPHFLVEYDGTIIQAMDTTSRADANWSANTHAVSIETASNHDATDRWTQAQLNALVKLGQWLLEVHPTIGRRVCRSNTDPGFGYHRLFHEWNLSNHSCPGNARVVQFAPLVAQILAPVTVPDPIPVPPLPTKEDDAMEHILFGTNGHYLLSGGKAILLDQTGVSPAHLTAAGKPPIALDNKDQAAFVAAFVTA